MDSLAPKVSARMATEIREIPEKPAFDRPMQSAAMASKIMVVGVRIISNSHGLKITNPQAVVATCGFKLLFTQLNGYYENQPVKE